MKPTPYPNTSVNYSNLDPMLARGKNAGISSATQASGSERPRLVTAGWQNAALSRHIRILSWPMKRTGANRAGHPSGTMLP
jgi:hypothetical protein